MKKLMLPFMLLLLHAGTACARQGDPKDTEQWEPKPPKVTGTVQHTPPPSDALVLFDGKNLNEWVSSSDTSKPAAWTVADGAFIVKKGTGNIQTKRRFLDYQLHIEWKIPEVIHGSGQGRGNSGVFLALSGDGDNGYEIQVLDNYENETYVNGQAGSIYKQHIPLANACAPPGTWQSYDIVWTAPRFDAKGKLISPAKITAIHNGVLIQNNTEVKGITRYIGQAHYKKAHGASAIMLQDHGDPSEPISFRNIWLREL